MVDIMSMIYCSACGTKNTSQNKKCVNCDSLLKQKYLVNGKTVDDFNSFFTQENLKLLQEPLTPGIYKNILYTILDMGSVDLKINPDDSAFKKVFTIAKQYTNITYKSRGSDLGLYEYNTIFLDDRLDESVQIATIIHELAHHIFAEIFEQIVMYKLNIKKNSILESFVLLTINGNEKILAGNEFSAHTTEGRFILHGCQAYGSFIKIVNEKNFNKDQINESSLFGNTMANDIITILEHFIKKDLRDEIKTQYRRDLVQIDYDEICLEREDILDINDQIDIIQMLINNTFSYILENRDMINDLNEMTSKFNSYKETYSHV